MIPIFSGRIFLFLKEKMDSPTSNLSLNPAGYAFNIQVVSSETEEIILYAIIYFEATFEGVIDNLKKLGKPSNLFYYNGNTTKIKPTDKINSFLPFRQSQVVFWASSGQLVFPTVQPRENNILVLMITSDFDMLAFDVPGSTYINQTTVGNRPLIKLIDGNQTTIRRGTVSENLPIRTGQIIFLLEEEILDKESYKISGGYQKMIEAGKKGDFDKVRLLGDRIIGLLYTPDTPMAGPNAPTRTIKTLGNKIVDLILLFYQTPFIARYIDVTRMTSTGRGTSAYFPPDQTIQFFHRVNRNLRVSKTFPIAYATDDQYMAALKMMGITDYYP